MLAHFCSRAYVLACLHDHTASYTTQRRVHIGMLWHSSLMQVGLLMLCSLC
jgi:hypothetical protein